MAITIPAGSRFLAEVIKLVTDATNLLTAPPRARLRQTSAQSIPNNTYTSLTFNAEDYDSHNAHSTSSNTSRYVAQVAGYYQVSGKVAWAGNTTGRRASAWAVNGTQINGTEVAIAATSAAAIEHPAVTVDVLLAVNDFVELQAFQESGGALNTGVGSGAAQSVMTVRWTGT